MENQNILILKIPTIEELDYRKKILSDEDTMSYNKGCEEFQGYNPYTGCIDFNEGKWSQWFSKWITKDKERYYSYIIKCPENIPVGEVALRYDELQKGYCVSIIIEHKYRGCGYSEEALNLLLEVAFNELKAEKVFDNFPQERTSSEKIFKKVGFKRTSLEIVELMREDYYKKQNTILHKS